MASASKTPNLNLPQWVGTEKPERTDFNAAFNEIDANLNLVESRLNNVPRARLQQSAAQTIPNTTWTQIALNVEVNDIGDCYKGVNGQFTIPEDGLYLMTGFAAVAGVVGAVGFVSLRVNHSAEGAIGSSSINLAGTAGQVTDLGYSCMHYCLAGQIVAFQIYQSTGAPRSLVVAQPQSPSFSIVKLA